jgi:hypothetical protein
VCLRYLAEKIDDEDELSNCAFCESCALVISVEELAAWVHPVYRKSVERADDEIEINEYYDRMYRGPGGVSPTEILQELLGCEFELAEFLCKELKNQNWRAERDGEENYYDDDQYDFSLSVPRSKKWYNAWNDYDIEVKISYTVFHRSQKKFLDDFFASLLRGEFTAGNPPFITIGHKDGDIKVLYRAREASSVAFRERIYRDPVRELGAPPPQLRRQGRLNAAGISAFYASTDIHTAVAEI